MFDYLLLVNNNIKIKLINYKFNAWLYFLFLINWLRYLYLSTHCFLVFPGTSLEILVQRSFADKVEGCFFKAASKAFCCSSLQTSSSEAVAAPCEASFFSSSGFLVSLGFSASALAGCFFGL